MAVLISTPEGYATWVKLREAVGAPVGDAIANAKPASATARRRTRTKIVTLVEHDEHVFTPDEQRRAAMARVAAACKQ